MKRARIGTGAAAAAPDAQGAPSTCPPCRKRAKRAKKEPTKFTVGTVLGWEPGDKPNECVALVVTARFEDKYGKVALDLGTARLTQRICDDETHIIHSTIDWEDGTKREPVETHHCPTANVTSEWAKSERVYAADRAGSDLFTPPPNMLHIR